MLLLTAITDKIDLITSAAVAVDVSASYMDMTNADPPVVKGSTSGRQNTAVATAATTDIVAAPVASTVRNVKTLHIRNKSTTTNVDVTVRFNQNATAFELFKTTLTPGSALEYVEGVGFFVIANVAPTTLMKVLAADDAGGQNALTAQPWFPTQGAVAVAVGTYLMDGRLLISRAAGVVSHTTNILFAGTATYTITYMAKVNTGDIMGLSPVNRVEANVATSQNIKAASVSATEQITVDFEGVLRVTVAGTFIPQFIYSAAPGGTPTILKNSRLVLTPIGDASFVSQGVWA